MAFEITFDYRFDTSGFFNDPARRAALEEAARLWEAILKDELPDLPAGISFDIINPSDGVTVETVVLTDPVDDLIIFVGARNLPSYLALAGPSGYSAAGDIFASRISNDFRGQGPVSDFEPWAGTIVFDAGANWSYNIAGPVPGLSDFVSVAMHEIGHILGFGTSAAFDAFNQGGVFVGPNTLSITGGAGVPLTSDQHVQDGYLNESILMDPTINFGTRKVPTDIDKAILSDIGWEIDGFIKQGTKPPIATDGSEIIFGSIVSDTINGLGGDDEIQGNAGDDILRGGPGQDVIFGQAGRDIFVLGPGDGQNQAVDFDVATEEIWLLDSGFSSVTEALGAISKPFSNVSRITLSDGSYMDVFHAPQLGTPLKASNIKLATSSSSLPFTDGDDLLFGKDTNDTLVGGAGNDILSGGAGTDTAVYFGDQSSYTLILAPGSTKVTDRRPGGDGTDTLIDVELLDFASGTFDPFDLTKFGGPAGLSQAEFESFIELYIAYFNRAPDAIGLNFWGTAYATGTSLEEMASLFVNQKETLATYPPGTSNFDFAVSVYKNVLGRTPDEAGINFWVDQLDKGTVSRDKFILEVLRGAKSELKPELGQDFVDQQKADRAFLETKTDIGAYFAVHKGMSDVGNAAAAMALFDGTKAGTDAAVAAIDGYYADALDPDTGEFLMQVVGVLDDPFGAA